jgi:hypothetical protein
VTLSTTELTREPSLAEEALPEGSDSARITLSKTKATACLNVAAAVLNEQYVIHRILLRNLESVKQLYGNELTCGHCQKIDCFQVGKGIFQELVTCSPERNIKDLLIR